MILLDIVLPRLSGAAVMEHLHEHAPDDQESVVVVTRLDLTEIRKHYPGVREALARPVLPARLRKAVRRFLPGADEAAWIHIA
jgi:CheY-like chemotaxis protein